MTAFFVDWELWEKMTFCLALAIVLAIILGFAKNLHTRWKSRHYSTVGDTLLETSPTMVETQPKGRTEAPFGIRALERGIEIEGVWISQPNTPVASRPGSPASSAALSTSSSFLDEPTTPSFAIIEAPTTRTQSTQLIPSYYAPSNRTSDTPSAASWTIDTNGFKHVQTYRPSQATSKHRDSAKSTDSHTSERDSMEKAHKRTLPASSDEINRPNSTTTSTTSPSRASRDMSKLGPSAEEIGQHGETQKDTEELLRVHKSHNALLQPGADLGLLYSHRLSHVAETGQLIPRAKRSPIPSGDWSRTTPVRDARVRHPPISMNNRRKSRSLPSTPTLETQDPFSLALFGTRPEPTYATETSKDESEEGRSPSTAQDDFTRAAEEMMPLPHSQEQFYSTETGAISAIATLLKPEAVHKAPEMNDYKESNILRKVNDGFEILRPGTILTPETSGPHAEDQTKDKANRRSRRLSKERPPSWNDRNSFIEVLYGSDSKARH